jgi:hypothetical protein
VVGDSKSNGIVERGIQSIEQQVRVLKSALEERWKLKIPSKHAVVTWIVEYAAFLLNRFEVGRDGKTSYERCKGKKSKLLGIEFGEAVLWRRKPIAGALGKLTCLWEDGVYLGIKGGSGEIIIGNLEGVWKSRTIQRKPIEDRWPEASAAMVIGVPWRVNEADPDVDGERLEVLRLPEADVAREREKADTNVPNRFFITKKDLETHGYSHRCPGCTAVLRGTARQGHSEGCRQRLAAEMKEDAKVKRSEEKSNEFLAKTLEEEELQRNAKKAKTSQTTADAHPSVDVPLRESPSPGSGGLTQRHAAGDTGGAGSSGDQAPGGTLMDERKRQQEEAGGDASRRKIEEAKGEKRELEHFSSEVPGARQSMEEQHHAIMRRRLDEQRGEKRELEPPGHGGAPKKVLVGKLEVMQEEEDEQPTTWEVEQFFDEKTGRELEPKKVAEARKEEVGFMKRIVVYEDSEIDECWQRTGKAPITTKWVGTNKGTDEEQDVRMRLVARDFKTKGNNLREDLFAAMPPLESKKMLFRIAAAKRRRLRRARLQRMKLMFIDVKKAHLNGVVEEGEDVYIELPPEANAPGKCGKLRRWLYGMRPAARAWEKHYTEKLESIGFLRGKSAPTAFFNPKTEVRCVVHGDDFTFLGFEDDLQDVAKAMKGWYELKVRGILGDEPNDDKEIVILGRTLKWGDGAITYQADDRHAKVICEAMGVKGDSKGLTSPIVKSSVEEIQEAGGEPLDTASTTEFRSVGARANYLAMDRSDIQFAAKEICRDMSSPTQMSIGKLKRLARYLLEYPALVWTFDETDEPFEYIDIFSDSDWAGCLKTRRSTSGGVASIAGGAIKTWSSTQSVAALSSGEAEYYALVKAAAEGLGIQSLAKDLGWDFKVRIWVDATAARGIACRTGLGKIRHMETKVLWVQDALKRGRFTICKIDGTMNPSDVLTKPASASEMKDKLAAVGARLRVRAKKVSWADATEEEFGAFTR